MDLDTIEPGYLYLAFYLLFFGTLAAAFAVLKKFRGNSLLAITIVSITLQVGTFYWYLPYYAMDSLGPFVEPGYTRLGICMCIFFAFSIAGLCFYYRNFPAESRISYSAPIFKSGVILVAAAACVMYLGLRFRTQGAELVLTQGLDVLGGAGYYDLRSELIEVGKTAPNRFVSHFELLTRKFLFCLLLTCSYFWSRYRSRRLGVATVVLTGVLLVDEFIRFQKAPVVVVLAGSIIPYLIGYGEARAFTIARKVTVGLLAAVIVFVISAGSFVITMGTAAGDVFWMVFERFFLVPPYTGSLYCQVYPELLPHVWFTTINAVSVLFNTPPQTQLGAISLDVAEAIFGNAFNANSSMVPDGYANGGYFGVVLVCGLLVALFIGIDRVVSRVRQTHDITPLIIFYWSCIITFGNGAFVYIVLGNALWFVPFVYSMIFRQVASASSVLEDGSSPLKEVPSSAKLLPNGLL